MVFGEGDAFLAQEAHDGVAAERGLSLAVRVRIQPDEGVDADDVILKLNNQKFPLSRKKLYLLLL